MTTEGDAPAEEGAPPEVAASEPVEEATEETAEETVVEETTEETAEETVVEEPETTDPTNPEAPPEPEAEASTSKPAMMMMDEAEIARKLESGDKDDRVAARRARIAARLKAKREAEDPSLIEPEPEPEPTAEETQVKTSKRALARLKAQGFDDVTDVKAVAVAREANRRGERDTRRVERRNRIEQERTETAQRDGEVAGEWDKLRKLKVAHELNVAIQAQKALCDEIISSKDALIAEMTEELDKEDEAYERNIRRQEEEVDETLRRMNVRYNELSAAYVAEFDEIERVFLEERRAALEANTETLERLFKQRDDAEIKFMESTGDIADAYRTELEKHEADDAEEFSLLKIRLESDIGNLQRHLADMKSTYLLNAEKLEYNYRVLVERDHENAGTLQIQRRKIAKTREKLMKAKDSFAAMDKKFSDENMRLTDDHRRVTEQFKELEIKFRTFQANDRKKFKEVWAMKEEEMGRKVKRALDADRVLHEQHLGMVWHAPSEDVFKHPEQLALEQARKKRAAAAEAARASAGEEALSRDEDEAALDDDDDEEENPFEQRMADPAYGNYLATLVDVFFFLVDPKAQRAVDAANASVAEGTGASEEERLTVDAAVARLKAESVLKAKGVTDAPSFDGLASALTFDGADPVVHAGGGGDVAGIMLPSTDLVASATKFAEAENIAKSGGSGGRNQTQPTGDESSPAPRKTKEQLEKEYWENMSNAVGEKNFRVWSQLERSMERYREMLMKRRDSLRDAESLREQNDELRGLLSQYLSSSVNDELMVPPAAYL
jgi:dynein regulatory complex protein 1